MYTPSGRVKVLMFGWEFPPYNSGGLGVACYGLTRALARENADITFVLPKQVNVDSDFMKFVFAGTRNINIKTVNSILMPYMTSETYDTIRSSYKTNMYGWNLFDEVKRYALEGGHIAEEIDCDVIHAHDWLAFGAGMEAARVTGKPLIVHVHATEFDRTGGNGVNQHVYEIEKEGMEQASIVIAISHFTKNIITTHYGIPPEKIRVVHNGADHDMHVKGDASLPHVLEAHKRRGKKIVLFVGRITLQKGPDYFVQTAKRVLEYNKNVLFVVAGSGDMERKIIRDVADLGISDKVFFTGFLRDEELSRIYRAADLYVLPSVSEPFGITPLEAMLHGTPILISKQSGVSEVVTHALKADFWDVEDMTDKILAVLEHPSLHRSLQEHAGTEVRRITWNEAARKMMSIYTEVLTAIPARAG